MTQELDNILKYLSSTDAQLTFLRSIYVPGRIDVADEIILRSEDSSIIRKEIAHAKQACDYDRFRSLAKRYIDYHVSHDFDILLVGIVKEWQDSELADYTIEKMTSKPEKDRKLENPLEYSAEIAQAFGKEDVARDILERLLGLVERDSEYRFPAAQVLEKLGRFDEAIDRYLEAEWVSDAFYLAKEQSPIRSVENAEVGFKNYKQDRGSAQFYVECAELLGKTGQAEKKLVRYAKKVNVVHSPRFYVGIVKSLVLLGQEAVASKFVEKVARHEEQARNSDRYYEFSRSVEMAELYHAVGETDAVRNIYAQRIDARIKEGHHPSNILHDIDKAVELTGDQSFREKELDILERKGEYQEAAGLAAELGKPDLVQTYSTMHQMVEAVKIPVVK